MRNDARGFVSGAILQPGNDAAEWYIADRKAKAGLILSMSPSQLKQIEGCNTSKEVWNKLNGPVRKATLLKKYVYIYVFFCFNKIYSLALIVERRTIYSMQLPT